MLTLIAYYWIWLLAAFLIGLLTALWTWGQRPDIDHAAGRAIAREEPFAWPDTPARPTAPAAAQPVAPQPVPPSPVPDVATRIATPIPMPAPPAPPPAPPPVPLPDDDLTIIKGIGPQLNTLLRSLGVHRFEQIAAWSAQDIARVDAHLGVFRGRILRDEWVDQARLLAAGDMAGFIARYGEQ